MAKVRTCQYGGYLCNLNLAPFYTRNMVQFLIPLYCFPEHLFLIQCTGDSGHWRRSYSLFNFILIIQRVTCSIYGTLCNTCSEGQIIHFLMRFSTALFTLASERFTNKNEFLFNIQVKGILTHYRWGNWGIVKRYCNMRCLGLDILEYFILYSRARSLLEVWVEAYNLTALVAQKSAQSPMLDQIWPTGHML